MHTVAANLSDPVPDHHPQWTVRPLNGPQHPSQGQGRPPTTHGPAPCQPGPMGPLWGRSAGPRPWMNSCTGIPLVRYKKWLPYFKKDKFLNDTYITQISVASHLLHNRSLYQNLQNWVLNWTKTQIFLNFKMYAY